jgi:hypothetical protein
MAPTVEDVAALIGSPASAYFSEFSHLAAGPDLDGTDAGQSRGVERRTRGPPLKNLA